MSDRAADPSPGGASPARSQQPGLLDSVMAGLVSGLDVIAAHAADTMGDRLADQAMDWARALVARSLGLVAGALGLIWLSIGLSAYLETLMPAWGAGLTVAAIFGLLAIGLLVIPRRVMGAGRENYQPNQKEHENDQSENQSEESRPQGRQGNG